MLILLPKWSGKNTKLSHTFGLVPSSLVTFSVDQIWKGTVPIYLLHLFSFTLFKTPKGRFFYVLYSSLFHLPPISIHCVGASADAGIEPEVGERSDWSIFRYRFDLPIVSADKIGWCQGADFIASSMQENFFSVFSIASSVQENFLSVFSIASSVKKTLPYKIVLLYSIFFSKIVCQYCFNRYIFEYRCPSLDRTQDSCNNGIGCQTLQPLG